MTALLPPTSSPPESTKRRRGAPDGNRNALKHGFYARRFKRSDLSDLEAHQFSGLMDEIPLLRVFIRRLIDLSARVDDLYETLDILRVLCLATASLTRLIRTHHLLLDQDDEVSSAIRQALEEMTDELGLSSIDPSSAPHHFETGGASPSSSAASWSASMELFQIVFRGTIPTRPHL